MNQKDIKLVVSDNKEFVLSKKSAAYINPQNCVNCGTCREYCPVNAIGEKQKEICRLCPDCTEMPALTVEKIEEMTESACTLACPLGISPQGYINLLKSGKEEEAYKLIWNKNPLPAVCGYICHHPCEQECKRGKLVDRPIEIRGLKRFLGEKFLDWKPESYPVMHEEKIAVVGGGPAGLTAAHWLAKKGYKVTVYEQSAEAGGMLLRCIPNFRLNKDVVRKEIKRLEEAGIEIITGAKIGLDSTIEELKQQFDRVVIASGTQRSKKLKIEGWRTEQILYAADMMEKVNCGQAVKISGNVVVIGGGSVAADTARAALRIGAEKVTMICLESGEKVPAHPWELEEAKEEGIDIFEGVTPKKFVGNSSKLEGIEVEDIKNLEISSKGLTFDVVPGTARTLEADYVIVAIGQESDRKWPQDDEKVYFAGDIAGGKCSVIEAMASGRTAAIAIDNELRGREYSEYEVERRVTSGDKRYKIYPAVRNKLIFEEMPKMNVEERINSFEVVEKGFNDEQAKLETYRCLACGYHAVDTEKCLGCGVCQKVCPQENVIKMVSIDGEVK